MKFALILAGSLAAGLALGTLARKWTASAPGSSSATGVGTNFVTNEIVRVIDAPAAIATNAPTKSEPFHWSQLQSSDLKQYIANLRTVGCPEQTVRDIILAIVNERFAPRFEALKPQPVPYWKKRRTGYVSSVEQRKALATVEKERRDLLRDLLGYEVKEPDHRGYVPAERDQLAFLSPERREAVEQKLAELKQRHEARVEAYIKEVQARGARDDFDLWRQLQMERRNDLASILTPAELEEYDLRNSYLAADLRHSLSGFKPTAEEFREIFRLQQKLREQLGGNPYVAAADGKPDNVDPKEWNTAKERIAGELKAKIGEERFAIYQRSQNYQYQELIRAADQYSLSPDVPEKVWAVREMAEHTRRQLLAMPNMSDEQRQAALAELAAHTETEVQTIMGADAFRRFNSWRPNSWIKNLAKVADK